MWAALNQNDPPSWHFSVMQDGRVFQHYEADAVCWHAGSPRANRPLVGVEHEGGLDPWDEPLTEAQYQASLTLVRWLFGVFNWGEPARRVNLWEHREWVATACPSDRIPWERLLADLQKEAGMPADDLRQELRILSERVDFHDAINVHHGTILRRLKAVRTLKELRRILAEELD